VLHLVLRGSAYENQCMNPRATLNKLENMFGDFGTSCCANGGFADGGMLKIWERSAEIPTSQTIPIHGDHTVCPQGVSPIDAAKRISD